MNGGGFKGQAFGFSISLLNELSFVKAKDNKTSLI
jgi:hypothetical protein